MAGYSFGVRVPYEKPWKGHEEQLLLLRSRGLGISDETSALHHLARINYYRFAGYLLPFEEDHSSHALRAGTTFEEVYALYEFDARLRRHTFEAIEFVEIAFRARWAYEFARAHGPHAHLNCDLADDRDRFADNLARLIRSTQMARETFISHLLRKYAEPLPPLWAVSEVMSFGELSKWYTNLKSNAVRKAISHAFGMNPPVLASWLHHLSTVRNICAHHSRLWNREFTVTPKAPQSTPEIVRGAWHRDSRKLFNTLVILRYFAEQLHPDVHWGARLEGILRSNASVDLLAMGFPTRNVADMTRIADN